MTIRDEAFAGQPVSTFIIDAHTHICPYYMSGWYESPCVTSNAAIIALLDRVGINCIVTAPHFLIMGMMESANKAAAEAADQFPGRIYGYISICPGEGLSVIKEELRKYEKDPRFIGLKLLPGYHGSLSQKEYSYAMDFSDEKACVVLTHTWANAPSLSEVEALLEKRTRVKLICAHQGGGSAELSYQLAEIIKRHANLYMETCGSLRNTLSMEDFVKLVGEDRLIYGSDLINLDVRYDFGRVVFSPLSDDIKKKLLSGNFLSLLRNSEMGRVDETGNKQE